MDKATLIAGLAIVGIDGSGFHIGDSVSARGPCFICGGHQRMVIFFDQEFPRWWVRCDLCGTEGWLNRFYPSADGKTLEYTPEKTTEEMQLELQQTMQELQNKLASEMAWQCLHDQMTEDNRKWWRAQGIPDDWQDFWHLGYTPKRSFLYQGDLLEREAYTIPKFDSQWVIRNIDYRLVDPPLGAGKYRPIPHLGPAFFLSRPDLPCLSTDGRLVIVEGSKKAMVLSIHMQARQIVGIPGARSWAGIVERLQREQLQQVVVLLDPDAEAAAAKLAKAIGPTAIRLTIPTKPDDAFLQGLLDEQYFWHLVKQSGRRTI